MFFEEFSPDSFHDAGDHVFCFGHIGVRAVATGQSIDNRFPHVCRIEKGQMVAFTEFTDTVAIAVGTGALRVVGEERRAA
ncbi:hypothetical protein DC522_30500 [Microvirga sp. KLBC 81]|uniref:nuclear transport factor 2 family protein n=1 Tax=Microvirga sp. KLBC 81 TaxID=1862707 RepID=UPI000D518451|nr:hypothetical protein [Microvirga sp. KLBC 81]PVE20738.1 hypothetical protein DC522_30500 [Microvirga sp. KLBC 81]